jgi:hypothetical protein
MENITISNLVLEIKNNNEKANKLRSSITQQKEDLMAKVRMALENEGLELQPKWDNSRDIYIGNDNFHNNNAIRVSFGGGNFHIQLPPIYNTPNAHIQFVIYSVLAKFQSEVIDIQLDIVNETNIDKHRDEWKLQDEITEDLFRKLRTDGKLVVDGLTYEYNDFVKGRMVLNITSGSNTEVKSYFPNMVKDKLKSHSYKIADTLLKY